MGMLRICGGTMQLTTALIYWGIVLIFLTTLIALPIQAGLTP
jgi:hypothetical protein